MASPQTPPGHKHGKLVWQRKQASPSTAQGLLSNMRKAWRPASWSLYCSMAKHILWYEHRVMSTKIRWTCDAHVQNSILTAEAMWSSYLGKRYIFKWRGSMTTFEYRFRHNISCVMRVHLPHWWRCNCRLWLEMRHPRSPNQLFLQIRLFDIDLFQLCKTRTGNSSSRLPSIKKHMSTTSVRTYLQLAGRTCLWAEW